MNERAKIIGISRHRLSTDGQGVTTLVGFHGCSLRCKYCLNPNSFDSNARAELLTAQELYQRLSCDDLYFRATDGGVTFGGGEPLHNMDFLEEFSLLVGKRWHLTAETSLYTHTDNVRRCSRVFDSFIVDIKDTDPEVYRNYTGGDVTLPLENLRLLIALVGADAIKVRLPLIDGYNTQEHRDRSQELLRGMGIVNFDKFNYIKKRRVAADIARLS